MIKSIKYAANLLIQLLPNKLEIVFQEKWHSQLIEAGISAIDVAGAERTSWAKVESERAQNLLQDQLGKTFADWGISTADCILQIRERYPEVPLIVFGGLPNELDVVKVTL